VIYTCTQQCTCVPNNDEDPSQGELGNIAAGGSASFINNNNDAIKSAAETTAIALCSCTTNADFCVRDQFTFTGTTGGTCTISTVGGTTLDSVLYAFTSGLGACIGCNDDASLPPNFLASQFITSPLTNGQTYEILKCSFDSTAKGPMTVTVTC